MALLQENLLLLLLFFCMALLVTSIRQYTPPNVTHLTDLFSHVPFDQGLSTYFGGPNIKLINNGSYANIALDKSTGSGLISRNKYYYGFFSSAIKLPAGISSGVVVAFYLSNTDVYPNTHDEIDIELLGDDKTNVWVLQTNLYANGIVSTGREEKFYFWFDPTEQYHQYSIIWNSHHKVFLLDNIPLREFPNTGAFASTYPSKPMSLCITIWDGSAWATNGGRNPVNYTYAPFVASLTDMEMSGCISTAKEVVPSCPKSNPSGLEPVYGQEFAQLSEQQRIAMNWARSKLMFYSYCKDPSRFKGILPPECK
ncbi:Glyco_hydro_16 domain-containing protein/XET_C domain-containing protein [Cephalotus follicularis]|uniref:Xyloglucan endotransglucosylase/hydrolase n=1 Tax=Cephalotus follicularis TaxID=3775 RepID=A0A1Q3CFB3_CEPFO|nr:Glyco_hydro_16 domain-containing protein/XET_C domain-containing protein [Cephalotus follicularis]